MQRGRVCVGHTHIGTGRVGACFTRGKKCCVIDFSLQRRGGLGVRPRPEKVSAEKTETKSTPPFLIGNVVSIGLILGP